MDQPDELPRPRLLVGRDGDRVFNEMYRQWALEHNADPDEDPEFLRAWRLATGHHPGDRAASPGHRVSPVRLGSSSCTGTPTQLLSPEHNSEGRACLYRVGPVRRTAIPDLTPGHRAAVDQAGAHLGDAIADLEAHLAQAHAIAAGIVDNLAADERVDVIVIRELQKELNRRYPPIE
ncbi:MAG: hypothetical protein JWQ95_4968 [Sphaerisporangium sp.]|jgi:hypothetical protein|nr:hypothetical protein [Sphaerisporangium sp.]